MLFIIRYMKKAFIPTFLSNGGKSLSRRITMYGVFAFSDIECSPEYPAIMGHDAILLNLDNSLKKHLDLRS